MGRARITALTAAAALLLQPDAAWALSARRTPVMGWSTWSVYGCGISEQKIKEQALAIDALGLRPDYEALYAQEKEKFTCKTDLSSARGASVAFLRFMCEKNEIATAKEGEGGEGGGGRCRCRSSGQSSRLSSQRSWGCR